MRSRIVTSVLSVMGALALVLGLNVVNAPEAQAAYYNYTSVENSLLSNTQSFLVCGEATGTESRCKYATRGYGPLNPITDGPYNNGSWFAQHIAAGPNQCFMHRERFKIAGSTATNDTPWANFCAGPNGDWMHTDDLTRFWGMGSAFTVQIIG